MSYRRWTTSAAATFAVWVLMAVPALQSDAKPEAKPSCHGSTATVVGTSHHDYLGGTPGPDVIVARGGNDEIYGGGGHDIICAGPGADYLFGDAGADVLRGGAGADLVEDVFGANQVFGGKGNDWLRSGRGDEHLDGGPGRDIVDYSQLLFEDGDGTHCRAIQVDLGAGSGQGQGFGLDRLVDIEDAYSGGGDDVLIGDDEANTFYVGAIQCGNSQSDDHVDGLGGSDTLTFTSDQIEGNSSDGRVQASLRTGESTQTGNGGVHHVTFTSIENLDGTENRDTLVGDGSANVFNAGWRGLWLPGTTGDVIHAGAGADTVLGMNGSDELHGGPGPDVLRGRNGDDQLRGNDGDDHLNGGRGSNENHGGTGFDVCHRPAAGRLVFGCEAP